MQELRLDDSTDPATRVALTRNDIAHQSVQALLDDLDYVTTQLPEAERGAAARAVLDHHRPAVSESLLSEEGRRLQAAARAALHQLADTDHVQTFDDVLIIDSPPTTQPTSLLASERLRRFGVTLGMTGAIATGGFAVGAILQRLV
ncbi:MAG: hypothetical protein R2710_23020 [Acidimicrobiales bacterium]